MRIIDFARKFTFFFVMSALFFVIFSSLVLSCDMKFEIMKGEKLKYSVGDEVIAKLTIVLTHRNCPEGINATKFELKGIEISGATRWDELSTGTFIRKLKLKIVSLEKGLVSILALRKCEKEGGKALLSLKTK